MKTCGLELFSFSEKKDLCVNYKHVKHTLLLGLCLPINHTHAHLKAADGLLPTIFLIVPFVFEAHCIKLFR